MYWYKQDSKKLLKVMFSYNNKVLIENEMVPSRFSPDSPDKAHLNLHIDSLEPGNSAMYFCASCYDTTLQSHCLLMRKAPGLGRKLWDSAFTQPKAPREFQSAGQPGAHTQKSYRILLLSWSREAELNSLQYSGLHKQERTLSHALKILTEERRHSLPCSAVHIVNHIVSD